jgi:hypothetical protein
MKTNEKTSTKPVAGVVPTEKAEAKNLRMVNTKAIEEAKIVEEPKSQPKKFNLDKTIEIIEALNMAKQQRARLLHYSKTLDEFDVEQRDEDLKETAYYQACKLTITDDKRNTFELRNPTLIRDVVEYLKDRFIDKLGEVEASIVLPS